MTRRRLLGAASVAALVLAPSAQTEQATFPGPNGRLVYTVSQLYVVNADGTGRRAVTTSTPTRPIRAFQPAWAPDGDRITFTNTVGTSVGGGIWIINADGTGGGRVRSTMQNDAWPTFSPDGRQIAFVRFANRFNRLFVVNVDGTGLRTVTTSDVHVEDPEWSPDGSKFAFSNGFDVYVVNADGSGLQNLTISEFTNARHPSWSPDGARIAYAVLNGVRVLPATGGGSTTVVVGGVLREVWEVSWSPDGRQIAFVNDQAGPLQEELYVVNADGSNLRRLNVDTETTVDWGRAGTPAPVAGVSVNVARVSGVVRVRLRGTNRFVDLSRLRNVPVGSEVDVTRGRVRLVSSAGGRRTQTGQFFAGRAVVMQPRGRAPVTTLRLSGPLACPRRSTSAVTAQPPRRRRLWGDARGRFRSSGRFASAAVRGTIWLTEDRCDGTFVRVRRGRVEVLDRVRNRRVIVRAGQSYLARAR